MQNILGLLLSFFFIFIVIGIATVYGKMRKGASENTRKFIHIMVGNWVFITPMFTKLWALILVPLCFVIINLLSRKHKLFSAMEREDDDYGAVYYAISMLVLTTATYLLRWPTLSFVGLLTMAYGDGFAAVVGISKGKHYPFSFSPTKSLEGSITLASFSFLITFFSLFILQGSGSLRSISLWGILFISLLTSVFAAFIELTGLSGCDNLSVPIGSGLFSTLCLQFGNIVFYLFLLLYLVVLITAFRWKAISADGIVAALLTGLTLCALGGMWIGLGLLAFFLLGSATSKLNNNNKRTAEQLQAGQDARNWKQVLSNSLPACILVWASYYFNNPSMILPALTVFAAATADTLSSELGMLSSGRVFSILSGKTIARGLSGGVTWIGLAAGLIGSVALSIFVIPLYGFKGLIISSLLGFSGTLIDSVVGEIFQAKYKRKDGLLQEEPALPEDEVYRGFAWITNNTVNMISLSIVAILGLFFI